MLLKQVASDIEIARAANMLPIEQIAEPLGIGHDDLELHGRYKAKVSLDLFEREPRLDQVAAIETRMLAGLEPCRTMPGVADVRVKGAIGVVELAAAPDLDSLRRRFADRGVWVRPFENVVYLMPPFIICLLYTSDAADE